MGRGSEGSRIGHREKLNFDAVVDAEPRSILLEALEQGWLAPQNYPSGSTTELTYH